MTRLIVSSDLVRNQVINLINDLILDDQLQIQSIQTLDQLTLDNHSDEFNQETNKAIEQLNVRINKYQRLSNYIKNNGCNDLSKLRTGLFKEANEFGHTYLTSEWHFKVYKLIEVLDSFKAIGINQC